MATASRVVVAVGAPIVRPDGFGKREVIHSKRDKREENKRASKKRRLLPFVFPTLSFLKERMEKEEREG